MDHVYPCARAHKRSGPLVAAWTIVAVLLGIGLAALFRHGPDRSEPRWQWVTIGSVFAIVAWIAVSLGLRFYITNFGSSNET